MELARQKILSLVESLEEYNVMAVSDRCAIVSRNLDPDEDLDLLEHSVDMSSFCTIEEAYSCYKDDPVYSIVDFNKGIRGPDNLVFGVYNYFDSKDCEKAISDLVSGEIEISRRNRAELKISRIE